MLRNLILGLPTSVLIACAAGGPYSPLNGAEPVIDATLERAPRTLRLYYDALPDVSRSSLRLLGPQGEYPLRDPHNMAADDLMVEIVEPLENGRYRVEWSTAVGDDPTLYRGTYEFTVRIPE